MIPSPSLGPAATISGKNFKPKPIALGRLQARQGKEELPPVARVPAVLAVLAAPGAAGAEELKLIQCEGGNIHGKGSSAQKIASEVATESAAQR